MKRILSGTIKILLIAVSLTACAHAPSRLVGSPAVEAGSAAKDAGTRRQKGRTVVGKASWYSAGHTTANGERFRPDGLTAAHRTLPFGTKVLVRNHANGKSVTLRINDRGPFIRNRIIDLSRGAARRIGMLGPGVGTVSMTVVGSAKP